MHRRVLIGISLAVFLWGLNAPAAPIKFARYPHVAHGKLAFSYHGDIWVAGVDGSNPRRLTAHVGRDIFPRFSPDGGWVAFTSNRMGNNDVFVMPATGGEPRQLTHATTNDTVLYWTPDGKRIIFATSRGTKAFRSPLFTISIDGGLPAPMEMDQGQAGMIKQDGTLLAFNRIGVRYWRKGYRGNRNADIWVQDMKTKKITQLTDMNLKDFRSQTQDAYPMWGSDGMIYFATERGGLYNIWRISPSGGNPRKVSSHERDGIQFPSISPDGRTIAYENDFDLWTLSVPNGKPKLVTIDMEFDPKQNLVEFPATRNKADGFHPSPTGDYLAVDFHGEIFVVPTDPEFGEKRQVTNSGRRDRSEQFSPDGKHIAYLSDESGDEEVWVYGLETGERRRLSTHESFKQLGTWSPGSERISFGAANRLFIADLENGGTTELAHNPAGGYQLSDFSPGGNWLVYTRRDEDMNSDVYLYDIPNRGEHNVTQNPFTDRNGTLSPDGENLVFLSNRDGGVYQLFVVSLERLREDPDDPLVKERLKKAKAGKKAGTADEQVSALNLEADGIERRAVQLTRGDQAVSAYFLSADGGLIYFLSSDEKGRGMFSIRIDGKDRKRVADGAFSGLQPTYDRKKVFYSQDGEIYQMPLSGQKQKTKVPFTFSVKVDRRAEWSQIFDESWRVMKYRFYDENMHGFDWRAIRGRYEPLLGYVGENQDLYDLTNEMIGELNASHTGVSGPPSLTIAPAYQSRYLGFEMIPDGGAYKISHIYRDGPADKEWLDLEVGNYVLSIDGHTISAGDNYWQILNHSLNEHVTVEIASAPSGAVRREVRIKTVSSLRNIHYEEWVKGNRDFVEKEADGQIAYVHIRSMNRPSLRRFENEISQFWNKKGIIVDIRYNGGGNIDQQLLDILERRPYEYWNSRWGARTWGRRPRQAIAGPKVMLINHRSGSDSEVTPMGFRDLGLGRIVGNPTSGAVIATGSYRLINGGRIRTPGSLVVTYNPDNPNNYGTNLENYGVAPDVWVENSPEDELQGVDRELKAAVDEALRMLRSGKWQYTSERNNNR